MGKLRIKNFTKCESFDTEEDAKAFQKQHQDDSDIVKWQLEDKVWWNVHYCSNGYYEYEI